MKDITQNITSPDRYLLRTTRRIGMLSYKSARVRFDHRTTVQGIKLPTEIIVEDEEGVVNYKEFTQFYLSDGNQSITLASDIFADINEGEENARARISIKVGAYYYNVSTDAWVETGTELVNEIPLDFVGPGSITDGTFLWFFSMNINTANIPQGAGDDIVLRFRRSLSDTGYGPLTRFTNNVFKLNNPAVPEGQNTAIDYLLTQESAARGRYNDGSIWFSDGPTAYARSAITRDEAGEELTSDWRYAGNDPGYDSMIHANILLREVMDMKRTQVRGLTSDLLGEYKPCKLPNIDDFFHFFIGGNQNGKDNKWAANLFRLNRVTDTEISNGSLLWGMRDVIGDRTVGYSVDDVWKFTRKINEEPFSITESAGLAYSISEPDRVFYMPASDGAVICARINEEKTDIGLVWRVTTNGGSTHVAVDEEGNVYVPHSSNTWGLVKRNGETGDLIWRTENDLVSTSLGSVVVDATHVYTTSNDSPRQYVKVDRETGAQTTIAAITNPSNDTREDNLLVFPEHLVYCKRASQKLTMIDKTTLAETKEIDFGSLAYNILRIEYDENGTIYALANQGVSRWTPGLEFIDFTDFSAHIAFCNEISVGLIPFPYIYMRSGGTVIAINKETMSLVNTISSQMTNNTMGDNARYLNAHPGRDAIRNKVLGL